MTTPDPKIERILAEKRWLDAHPDFEQRPATIREFMGADYLNIEKKVRPGIMAALIDVFGPEIDSNWISVKRKAVVTGGVGIGKTTFASIVLPYMIHWVYCLRDPQDYFGLMAGSRIAFMMMSTSEKQAKEVLFGDVKARIEDAPWFRSYCKSDPKFTNQLRFEKNLWILPGGSEETRFEGYNILGGIIDEGDSHKQTARKDYAEEGYDCVDEDTEILTKSGWKYHWDLSESDDVLTLNHETGMSEWNQVEEVRRFEVQDEELVKLEGKEFSAFTTKNHRWPVTHAKTGERSWTVTDNLYRHDKIQVAAPHAGLPSEQKYSDAFVETVAWGYTEGGIALDMDWETVHRLTIYQKTSSANCARMRDAFTKVFGPQKDSLRSGSMKGLPAWREIKRDDRDLSNFVFNKSASQILVEHFPNKVPTNEFIMSLTKSQLELFIQVSLLADNCGENKLAQKNHKAAEAFALACILAGSCVSIRLHHDRANEKYSMMLARRLKKTHINPYLLDQNKVNAFSITKEAYTGTVWCPRTKNKSWFARRNGSVYYTGNTINSRIESRFMNHTAGKHRGILIIIGQTKSATGFMRKMYDEFVGDKDATAIRMSIWESIGWHNFTENEDDAKNLRETAPRKSFVYDVIRKEVIPKSEAIGRGIDFTSKNNDHFIEVPTAYLSGFVRNPVKALRDLAGIPPESADPFISLTHKITSCQDTWESRMGTKSPVNNSAHEPKFEQWFRGRDRLKRVLHVDMAYCVDEETEIFTQDGWKTWDTVTPGDMTLAINKHSHMAKWEEIKAVNIFEAKQRTMLSIEGKLHSSLTTMNHKWYVNKRIWNPASRTYEGWAPGVVRSYELNERHSIVKCAPVVNLPEVAKYSDALVEVVAWFWTEGNICKNRDGSYSSNVTIYQSCKVNDSNCSKIESALETLFGEPVDSFPRIGRKKPTVPMWRYYLNGDKVCYYLNSVAGQIILDHAPGKIVNTDFIMSLTRSQLDLFVETSYLADRNNDSMLSQSDPRRLEPLQMALVLLGYATNRGENKYGMHWVSRLADRNFKLRKELLKEVEYEGHVWCPTTESGSWLARRKGKTFYTGNSAEGDALGMAMGHVPEIVEIDGEDKPLIVFDFLMRWHAAPGTEIILGEVRKLIYRLKFDLGFNLTRVTLDGFEGVDFRQQLAKNKIPWETLSVDKKKMPYEDLRDAIYDGRCLFPQYMTKLNKGDVETVNIAFRELSQLQDVGQKIDHPPNGSKDVADAMAAVTHYLMNDSQYRRGAVRARPRKLGETPDIPGAGAVDPMDLAAFLAGKDDKNIVSLDILKDNPTAFPIHAPDEETILSVDWSMNVGGLPEIPW